MILYNKDTDLKNISDKYGDFGELSIEQMKKLEGYLENSDKSLGIGLKNYNIKRTL